MSNSETAEGLTSDDPYRFAAAYSVRMIKKVRVTVLPSYSTRSEITSVEYATADLTAHSL